jgi:hypothetical protein
MRKIIQVGIERNDIIALCDDGSLWARTLGGGKAEWKEVEGIPDPAAEGPGPGVAAAGAAGAAGEKGPTGDKGATGDQGPPGARGAAGKAR